jgi:hypothetical protein
VAQPRPAAVEPAAAYRRLLLEANQVATLKRFSLENDLSGIFKNFRCPHFKLHCIMD